MRRLGVLVGILGLLLGHSSTGWTVGGVGGDKPPTPGGGVTGGNIYAEIVVGVGPYKGQRMPCKWARVPEPQPLSIPPMTAAYANKLMWYLFTRTCGAKVEGVWVAPRPPGVLAAAPLKPDFESKWIPLPEPHFAPENKTWVNLDTWIWTTPSAWREVQAYAHTLDANGNPIWAETTATPTRLIFDPGTGDAPTVCTTRGEEWLPEYGDEKPSSCMYRYLHSSVMAPNGKWFDASLSIEWTLTYRAWDGSTEDLGTVLTSADYDFAVGEIQAIIVA